MSDTDPPVSQKKKKKASKENFIIHGTVLLHSLK